MSARQRRERSCAGTSTLEFIVILPFLLIIMLTAVELSRALATYNVVVQASREGARQAVVTPIPPFANAANVLCSAGSTNPPIAKACGFIASVPSMSLAATRVTVNCVPPPGSPAVCAVDSPVTVTVTTTFTSIFADFFAFVGNISAWWGVPPPPLFSQTGFPMPHTTIMRYE